MKKIFIDGSVGTTGLRIRERLSTRSDIELITLPEELRKNTDARREALNSCDVAFLCLPDDAARQSVLLVENEDTVIIDASTAHRTEPGWVYGFPELSENGAEIIADSKRIAVPGCHAGGFVSLVYPLVANGVISPTTALTCHSVTGYSGGGKAMIADYSAPAESLLSPRQYGLTQQHKHLKEMTIIPGLEISPIFTPIVSNFYSGMTVSVPLFAHQLSNGIGIADVRDMFRTFYTGPIVSYCDQPDENGFISTNTLSGKDNMLISVVGNDERMVLISRFDNLGKGASGAAVECMNIVIGADPTTGLNL